MFSWLQVSTMGMQRGLLEREHQQLLLNPLELVDRPTGLNLSAVGHPPWSRMAGWARIFGGAMPSTSSDCAHTV